MQDIQQNWAYLMGLAPVASAKSVPMWRRLVDGVVNWLRDGGY